MRSSGSFLRRSRRLLIQVFGRASSADASHMVLWVYPASPATIRRLVGADEGGACCRASVDARLLGWGSAAGAAGLGVLCHVDGEVRRGPASDEEERIALSEG